MSERDPFEGAPDDPNKPGAGRHRAETSTSQRLLYRVVAPLAAVAVVVAVIVVLIAVRGHSAGNGPGAGVISAPTTTPIVTPSPTVRTQTTPPAVRTHPPPSPTPRHTRPPASRTAMAPVRVYNSTHITGLAHHVAAEIAQRGWTVPDVGNITNSLSATTVYYSPSGHAAAQHLAREFSGIRRVLPNSSLGVHYQGLTLILTSDWHD